MTFFEITEKVKYSYNYIDIDVILTNISTTFLLVYRKFKKIKQKFTQQITILIKITLTQLSPTANIISHLLIMVAYRFQ